MFGLVKNAQKQLKLDVVRYPNGVSKDSRALMGALGFFGVPIVGSVSNDARIIYISSPDELKKFARHFWHVQKKLNIMQDKADKEKGDCEDLVGLFQSFAFLCLNTYGHPALGGHGVMRLYVKYGATSWGESIEGKIPPFESHQVALVAVALQPGAVIYEPWVVDVGTADCISLSKLTKLTTRMEAKW